MKRLLAALLALPLAFASIAASAQQSVQESTPPLPKAAIEKIVHDYLVEHPEVIKEAIQALQAKEDAARADDQSQKVAQHKGEIFADSASPVAGNPVGDVTIVEFFDYHCPYCKAVSGPMDQLLKEDKGVRLVLKEFPILGDDSILASRAALAAVAQGKYWPFHQALMAYRGSFDMPTLKAIAKSVGIDANKMEADMAVDKTMPLISGNRSLADQIGIGATPTFIIGNKVVEGAISIDDMKALIKQVRKS
jgi:protein-disulfide isomerase